MDPAEGAEVSAARTKFSGLARSGLGVANVPLDLIDAHLASGRLERVLADWSEDLPAYHLDYPNCRHACPAFRLFLEAMRYRG